MVEGGKNHSKEKKKECENEVKGKTPKKMPIIYRKGPQKEGGRAGGGRKWGLLDGLGKSGDSAGRTMERTKPLDKLLGFSIKSLSGPRRTQVKESLSVVGEIRASEKVRGEGKKC